MTYGFTKHFEKLFRRLPASERERVLRSLLVWSRDPYHPSLRFKSLGGHDDLWSLRSGQKYRLLGKRYDDFLLWDWVGSHNDYEREIRKR